MLPPASLRSSAATRPNARRASSKTSGLGLTFKPNDRFSLDLDLNYFERKGWLLHQTAFGQDDPLQAENMTTFDAQEFQPRQTEIRRNSAHENHDQAQYQELAITVKSCSEHGCVPEEKFVETGDVNT